MHLLDVVGGPLLALTVLLPAAGGGLALRRSGSSGRIAVAGTAAGLLAAALLTLGTVADHSSSWFLGRRLLASVDPLAALLLLFVLSSTLVVQSFAVRSLRGDVARGRFFAASGCAAAATSTVAIAADLWVLVGGWVAVSVATVLLLRHDGRRSSTAAARRAAWTFLLGDAALVLAAIVATVTVGTVTVRPRDMSLVAASGDRALGVTSIAAVLAVAAVLAAVSRCALPPGQTWLPMSIAAPTPSSAVLHAGIVNGGGVLLIRFAPVLSASVVATALALAAGSAGVMLGSVVARTRPDVKSSLAWSTVSQMGFMVAQCAIGLFGPALVHMVAHGMYKSNLFLGSGSALRPHAHAPAGKLTAESTRTRVVHAAAVAVISAIAVGTSWAVVRPTSFDGAAGLVFLGFVTVTVAHLASTWLRTRERRLTIDLAAFAVLVGASVAAIAVAATLKRWLAPSLPEVESPLATLGAFVLAAAAVASWSVSALSTRPGRSAVAISSAAYLWAVHLGERAKGTFTTSSSEVRA